MIGPNFDENDANDNEIEDKDEYREVSGDSYRARNTHSDGAVEDDELYDDDLIDEEEWEPSIDNPYGRYVNSGDFTSWNATMTIFQKTMNGMTDLPTPNGLIPMMPIEAEHWIMMS